MSLPNLLGGGNMADCGPSNNPLSSLLKHSDRDASLHQSDNFRPAGPSAGPSAFRSENRMNGSGPGMGMGEADFHRFMSMENGGAMSGAENTFGMGAMAREMDALNARMSQGGQPMRQKFMGDGIASAGRGNWAAEFPQESNGPHLQEANDWGRAFMSSHLNDGISGTSAGPEAQAAHSRAMDQGGFGMQSRYTSAGYPGGMMGSMGMMNRMPMMGNMGMSSPMFQDQINTQQNATDAKGKERFVEINDSDWEEHFAKAGEAASSQLPSLDDIRNIATSAEGDGLDPEADEADAEVLRSLERTWAGLRDTLNQAALTDAELAAWEAEAGPGRFADPDYSLEDDIPLPEVDLDKIFKEPLPWGFTEENKYVDESDPFAVGQQLLASGAPLNEAALAFEAACFKDPSRGEAWAALGNTLAMDEKEKRALRALERAVGCYQDGKEGGEDAWISLAISYTNEGEELRSLATLERWLSLTYPDIAASLPSLSSAAGSKNPWARYEPVINLFLAAANAGPSARAGAGKGKGKQSGAPVDPDVQVGLGVLFYCQSEYEKAKDCFEAALSQRPDDFLLWNRLGATLANGGKPEEAIHAYKEALQLRPTFTRAYYNLAVSCLNIACYQEAAEYLLSCLKMQGTRNDSKAMGSDEGDDGSASLWHTLRRAFLCMDRHDLAERAKPGGDPDSFRNDGFDF